MRVCSKCGKKARIGRNRSHAQNRSSRAFRANIQKVVGVWLCTKCIKKAKMAPLGKITGSLSNGVKKSIDLKSKKAEEKKKEGKNKK